MSRPASIIIPSWNGRTILERNLPSVRAALGAYPGGGEVVVVDDGSTDDTLPYLASAHLWARVVARPANGGFGAAVGDGVRGARHDLLVLLNNDMRVESDFLTPLASALEDEPARFAVVPVIRNRTFGGDEAATICRFRRGLIETLFPERSTAGAAGAAREVLFACGGAAAFDRRRFLDLGGLDPLFAPFYWEDVDLSWRARKRGLSIVQAPRSVVHHEHGATIGARFEARQVRAVYERNRLLFQWKNLTSPRLTAVHLLWLAPRLARAPFGRLDFLRGFAGAVRRLPAALAGRRGEDGAARVSDEAILARFAPPSGAPGRRSGR
jgi:GT2 family glycosyltransferase